MNDQNKSKSRDEAPKSHTGARADAHASSWKKLLSKKWATPAAFMAAAAIIVTLMWVYQGTQQQDTGIETSGLVETGSENETIGLPEGETIEVTASREDFQWPVLNRQELEVILPFYDAMAPSEERQAALIQSGNTFAPHMGIDLAKPDDQSFDVLAALSGEVTHVEQHPMVGYVVEIDHGNELVTVYQSLSEVQVKPGDRVQQGTLIAQAGRNELEKDLGVHLHFEVRQSGEAVNPTALLPEVADEAPDAIAPGDE